MKVICAFAVAAAAVPLVQALPLPVGNNVLLERDSSTSAPLIPQTTKSITQIVSATTHKAHDVSRAYLEGRGIGVVKDLLEVGKGTLDDIETPLLQASDSSTTSEPLETTRTGFLSRFGKALTGYFKHAPADAFSSRSRNAWSSRASPLQRTKRSDRAQAQANLSKAEYEFEDARIQMQGKVKWVKVRQEILSDFRSRWEHAIGAKDTKAKQEWEVDVKRTEEEHRAAKEDLEREQDNVVQKLKEYEKAKAEYSKWSANN